MSKYRSNCAVCGQKSGSPTIELPCLPLTEMYVRCRPKEKSRFADQLFFFCDRCQHGQLAHIISPQTLYGKTSYYFRTSGSNTAKAANDTFVEFVNSVIGKKNQDTIIEFGCSDLYLLQKLSPRAKRLIGIDPILKGREKELSKGKLKVYGDFIENIKLEGHIDYDQSLIISSHTLEHLEDPKQILQRLLTLSSDNTIFIFQFPGLDVLVADLRYDQIFHQHLHYFSLESFRYLIHELGGELIDYKVNYYHWGTLMVAFKKVKSGKSIRRNKLPLKNKITASIIKKDYPVFQERMGRINKYIRSLRAEKTYGFGASLMLPILGYHLNNDFSDFTCILDDDENKEGLYYINLPVPIKTPKKIADIPSSNIVITAVNTPRSVLPRVLSLKPKRIILPVSVL